MAQKRTKALRPITKAQEAKRITKKYMLTNSFLKARQLLHILQRTPANHIYKRPGKGKQEFEYVTGTYMKKVLNYAFGWMWDFKVTNQPSVSEILELIAKKIDQIWVTGELTVKDMKGHHITKTQAGRVDIKFFKGTRKPVDLGNDLKAAITDCVKKCASEFGIASDIYGKNEFKQIQMVDKKFLPPANGNNKVKDLLASQKEKQLIEKYCRELGYSDPEKAVAFVKRLTGIELNLDKLTKVEASQIIAKLLVKITNKK